jgi:hypothetical protein
MKLNLEQAKSVVRKLNKAIAMMETQPEHRNKVIAMSLVADDSSVETSSSSDRMVAIAGFENWSKERQDAYIKRHPGSKRGKNGGASKPAAPAEKPGKAKKEKVSVKLTSDEQARKDRLLESQKGSKKKDAKPAKVPSKTDSKIKESFKKEAKELKASFKKEVQKINKQKQQLHSQAEVLRKKSTTTDAEKKELETLNSKIHKLFDQQGKIQNTFYKEMKKVDPTFDKNA